MLPLAAPAHPANKLMFSGMSLKDKTFEAAPGRGWQYYLPKAVCLKTTSHFFALHGNILKNNIR